MVLTKQDLEAIEGVVEKKITPLRQEMHAEFVLVRQEIGELRSDVSALRLSKTNSA